MWDQVFEQSRPSFWTIYKPYTFKCYMSMSCSNLFWSQHQWDTRDLRFLILCGNDRMAEFKKGDYSLNTIIYYNHNWCNGFLLNIVMCTQMYLLIILWHIIYNSSQILKYIDFFLEFLYHLARMLIERLHVDNKVLSYWYYLFFIDSKSLHFMSFWLCCFSFLHFVRA